ncbi:hypothetical protein RFI_19007 [Reticulomyxa filosa]|uniref:Uncharacterized protein n=1 Tax=Reticulomyxa filosa TaxID=46433 RepID=X6MYY2_RETFI|nr:hypothetical protein RFI_19007 [Reticulomyxa filosa]|eukprot:ETO18270.1 hypothetical protein RFI_19007 [Reticulomyxa filosa]
MVEIQDWQQFCTIYPLNYQICAHNNFPTKATGGYVLAMPDDSKESKQLQKQKVCTLKRYWFPSVVLGVMLYILILLITGPANIHPILIFHDNVPQQYYTHLRRTGHLIQELQIQGQEAKDDKEYVSNLVSVYQENFANRDKVANCTSKESNAGELLISVFLIFDWATKRGHKCNKRKLIQKEKKKKGEKKWLLKLFYIPTNKKKSCKLKRYLDVLKPSFREPTETSNLTYIHVHKCGGTSIIELYEYLYENGKIPYLYAPHDVVEEFYTITASKQRYLYYTYVRDPVARMISSYFEIHRRGIGLHFGYGIAGLRRLLLDMRSRKYKKNGFPWRINHHVWPQMLFLVDKIGNPLPMDYIGRMESMEITLPYLMEHFTADNNATELIQYLTENQFRSRTKDDSYISEIMAKPSLQKDNTVTVEQLSDEMILWICDLYWIDFYCLDLELPDRVQAECQNIIDQNLQRFGEQNEYLP